MRLGDSKPQKRHLLTVLAWGTHTVYVRSLSRGPNPSVQLDGPSGRNIESGTGTRLPLILEQPISTSHFFVLQ
jgi:hypothetical protein